MFLFLPILFGFSDKLKVIDSTARICPKCHNATVVRATSRMWFSLFLVPLVPFKKNHIWICSTCNWHVPIRDGWEPALPAGNVGWGSYQPGYQYAYQSPHQGYQPSYGSPHGY
ncbi:hypothetical protein EDB92DRAFT_1827101 [Lactarius akahatsu]|uniref:Zinc-ribbon 15 domain-containing protein n=1 Tax=Lactarius akahatsu TaxID=416441 RepID=A0AAD4QI66_9AGAM|nr:hypothetical protein EDB92DRAFT_1827101 [Lactarius akahatsu]